MQALTNTFGEGQMPDSAAYVSRQMSALAEMNSNQIPVVSPEGWRGWVGVIDQWDLLTDLYITLSTYIEFNGSLGNRVLWTETDVTQGLHVSHIWLHIFPGRWCENLTWHAHMTRSWHMTHDTWHGKNINSITELFSKCHNENYNLRRNNTKLSLTKPNTNVLKRSFSYRAAKSWNELSDEI